ncbi:hypothetical protein CPB83DRAFT_851860 [Crepidotus variabilis]|uniref:DUF6534 domain-containing protein n=1 Tax=Crepidotus variabilis TaxID=179855 RepID=A0A9P6EIX0_9AGAR|nr:hypothetical protein CPB83DRAFT_851860 [Crepidotus variabilis]
MAPIPPTSLGKATLDNTLGAVFLGVVGSALLSGITLLQVYGYYHRYPKDSLLNKATVTVLWILDLLHLCLIIHGIYYYVVTGYGKPQTLQVIPWSLKLQVTINIVIILIVHCLYAQRVWLLGGYHKGILGYVVAAVVAAGFVIGIVLSYLVYSVNTYSELERVSWVVYAAIGTSTAIDFVIALAMCYYLRKSKGSMAKLNSRISRIMQYSISSGLVTSAFSLTSMFAYILLPNTFLFLALHFMVTKLYVGSFMALLNSRERKIRPPPDFGSQASATWQRSLKLTTPSFISDNLTEPSPTSSPATLPISLPSSHSRYGSH